MNFKLFSKSFCFLVLMMVGRIGDGASFAEERAVLLNGVNEIPPVGTPGALALIGPASFAVVSGKIGAASEAVLVGAAHWEKGRVLAFGHGGYLGAVNEGDVGKLLANAVGWAAGKAPRGVGVRGQPKLLAFLRAHDFRVEDLEGKDWRKKLGGLDVLCIDAHALNASSDLGVLADFVKKGGGLITAGLGWGWQQLNPSKSLVREFPGNLLLGPAGIVWTADTVGAGEHGYSVVTDSAYLNAQQALEAVAAHESQQAKLSSAVLAQCEITLSGAMRAIVETDLLLWPKIQALAAKWTPADLPTEQKPLKNERPLSRCLLTHRLIGLQRAAPESVRADPSAENYPGAVGKEAPRVQNRVVSLDPSIPEWQSTGLYAPAGGVITVEIPELAVSQGLAVRIGCHNDELWKLESWARVPKLTQRQLLDAKMTKSASAFGGPIYLEVPKGCKLGPLEIKISGAVCAPYFVLGETTNKQWVNSVRDAPAPWAELAGSRVILSVPSSLIRRLENPEALMLIWDRIVAAEDALAGTTSERVRPERLVFDLQISAGWMHSGYPIMCNLKTAPISVSLEELKKSGWGFYHELGHNHQSADWTFAGTGEVTCNIFSLYICETIWSLPAGVGHEAIDSKRAAEALRKHLAGRASFERWKNEPFLALILYNQLRVAFGWEVYEKVFAEYRGLAKEDRPKNEEQKRDQWMVRFSRAAGKNLGPFFTAWGVPTSEAARESIQGLPGWMPADWPKL